MNIVISLLVNTLLVLLLAFPFLWALCAVSGRWHRKEDQSEWEELCVRWNEELLHEQT